MLAGAFAVKAKELFKSFDELKTGSASLLLRGLEQGTTQIRTLMLVSESDSQNSSKDSIASHPPSSALFLQVSAS